MGTEAPPANFFYSHKNVLALLNKIYLQKHLTCGEHIAKALTQMKAYCLYTSHVLFENILTSILAGLDRAIHLDTENKA